MRLQTMDNSALLTKYIDALMSEDEQVLSRAAYALGEIGDASAVPSLLEVYENNPNNVFALAALSKIGGEAGIAILSKAVKSDNAGVSIFALMGLERIGDVSFIPALLETLRHQTPYVRDYAAKELGKLGDEKTLPRKILADSRFSLQQRIDILERLRHARFRIPSFPVFPYPDTYRLCQNVLAEADADARRGAQEVLDVLDGNILLRASQADSAFEKEELLRGVQSVNTESEPDSLLRPFDALLTETTRPPYLWERLFGRSNK